MIGRLQLIGLLFSHHIPFFQMNLIAKEKNYTNSNKYLFNLDVFYNFMTVHGF